MSAAEDYVYECLQDPEFFFRTALMIRIIDPLNDNWTYTPFVLNDEQRTALGVILEMIARRVPVRLIVLKSRKLGISTLIQAIGFYWSTFRPPWRVLTMAHSADSTAEIGRIATDFVTRMPPAVRGLIGVTPFDGGLVWPSGSSLRVATQRSEDMARGGSPSMVLFSEVGLWEKNRAKSSAENTLQAALSSMDSVAGTVGVIESTAQGNIGAFPNRWNLAQAPRSVWRALFFPWQKAAKHRPPNDDVQLAVYAEMQRLRSAGDVEAAIASLRPLDIQGEWAKRAVDYDLTPAQVRWAEDKVDELGGDLARFDQEYPLSPRHAFMSSGRPVFTDEVIGAIELQQYFLTSGPLIDTEGGMLNRGERLPLDELITTGDEWQFYEQPNPDFQDKYVIGMDVGGGVGGDYTTIEVWNRRTMNQAAEFHCNTMLPEDAADQLVLAGYLFGFRKGGALVIPEANNHGHVVVARLEALRYPNTFRRSAPAASNGTNDYQKLLGFETNVRTRHLLTTAFASAVRKAKIRILSARLLAELRTFQFDDAGRMDHAKKCYSDAIIGSALAFHGHEWLGEVDPEPRVDTLDLKRLLGRTMLRFV